MKQEEVLQGNRLIAEFMGLKRKYESTEQVFIESLKKKDAIKPR